MDAKKCREAVETLCNQRGIEYNASTRGHDSKYIEEILKEVNSISDQMRRG
jgi:proteasome assembly chaperone (PAC2) family protein